MKPTMKYMKILCNLLSFLLLAAVIVFVLPKVLFFFMPFVTGFILSLIANPLVRFLERKIKMKRKHGTVLMIVLVIMTLLLLGYGTGMLLLAGIRNFMDYMPTMYENAGMELNEAFSRLQTLLHKVPAFSKLDVGEIGTMLLDTVYGVVNDYKKPTVSAIGGIAKSIPDILVNMIMGFLATYFFIADRDRIITGLNRHMPSSMRNTCMIIYHQIVHAVGGYFKAQFKIMGVIYIVITIGLMLLRVNFAWLIGFGIAFLDMLPVFGTGTVLLPWAAIKFFSGNVATAVGMLILYAVSQAMHQLMQPKMVGESVGLDPFATLFFMYIGYQFKGVTGMIIAIPAGMILCSLAEAGAFENIIWCFREIIRDFTKFCQIERKQTDEKERL